MAWLHELRVELLDQRANHIHVLHTIVKGLECLVTFDLLVLSKVRSGLVGLDVLEEQLEVISIDVVPKSFLPRFELTINDRDEIPHLLELNKLVLAVGELLLLCSLELEKLLQDLELLGFFLHSLGLFIVLTNLFVGAADNLRVSLSVTEWQLRLEFLSVVQYLDLELTNTEFNVVRLLGLKWKDSFLDRSESVVSCVIQLSSGILDGHKKINALGDRDINVVLLKKLDGVAKSGESLNSLLLDLGHVSQVCHHLREKRLISLRLKIFGENFDAVSHILDKILNVSELLGGVLIQEACVAADPAVDDLLELLDQWA